jgi:hypothetical protein
MRRTYQDLARAAGVPDLVTRSISGHATEAMQQHYSTVADGEQRTALARVAALMQGQVSARTLDEVQGSGAIEPAPCTEEDPCH